MAAETQMPEMQDRASCGTLCIARHRPLRPDSTSEMQVAVRQNEPLCKGCLEHNILSKVQSKSLHAHPELCG